MNMNSLLVSVETFEIVNDYSIISVVVIKILSIPCISIEVK